MLRRGCMQSVRRPGSRLCVPAGVVVRSAVPADPAWIGRTRVLNLEPSSMDVAEFLSPDAVLPLLRATTKKQALAELSKRAAQLTGLSETEILTALAEREALGSTGFGNGIAIPHAKLKGITRLCGVFARLERPIEFDAIDGRPVDLLCLLLAPAAGSTDHLKALARVARLLRDADSCGRLRGAANAEALYLALTDTSLAAGC